jgi:hypothetical protein
MKRSTKDPDAFLDQLVMNNIALMAMEKVTPILNTMFISHSNLEFQNK